MILRECALHLEYCHRCCVDFRDMNAYHRANAHHQPVATNPSADMRHAVMVCTGLGFIDDKWRDGIDSALEHATPVHRNVSAKAGRDSARRFIEGAKKTKWNFYNGQGPKGPTPIGYRGSEPP